MRNRRYQAVYHLGGRQYGRHASTGVSSRTNQIKALNFLALVMGGSKRFE